MSIPQLSSIHYPQFSKLNLLATTSTNIWNLRFSEEAACAANDLSLFLRLQGINPDHLIRPNQTHGDGVALVDASMQGCGSYHRENALFCMDALITKTPGLPIAIQTADCLPLMAAHRDGSLIGLAHLGWQGVASGLTEKFLEKLVSSHGNCFSGLRDFHFSIGPTIQSCCYEVGNEFQERFPDTTLLREDKWCFDLPAEVSMRLQKQGVPSSEIYDCGLCTAHRGSRLHSYRRDGSNAGRILTVMMIL